MEGKIKDSRAQIGSKMQPLRGLKGRNLGNNHLERKRSWSLVGNKKNRKHRAQHREKKEAVWRADLSHGGDQSLLTQVTLQRGSISSKRQQARPAVLAPRKAHNYCGLQKHSGVLC